MVKRVMGIVIQSQIRRWIQIIVVAAFLFLAGKTAMGQTGPGGVGDPTSNRFWYDANRIGQANNTPVSSWVNYGGNTQSADQGTAANRPTFLTTQINGLPVVRFDGTNDYLDIGSNTDLDSGGPWALRTFFLVTRTGANVTNRQVIYEEGGSTRGLNIYLFNGNIYFAGWNLNNDGPGSPWGFSSVNTAIAPNTTYVLSYVYSGNNLGTGNIQAYLNGNLIGTIPNVGLLYAHNNAILGAEISTSYYETGPGSSDGKYFGGDIAEFIHYNTAVNIAQRVIVENYLASKYGLTLTANDLYTMDDPGNGNYDFEMAAIGQVDNPANRHIDAQGTSVVRISGPVGLDDGEYLLWGHNNGSDALDANTLDVPGAAGVNSRYDRVWRTTMVGALTSYDVRFYLSCTPISVNNAYLLIDINGDGNFGDETVAGGGVLLLSNISPGEYIRTAVTSLISGRRFTFGFDGGVPPVFLSAYGPGGIGDNSVNRFWYDANDIAQANNTAVASWTNKGGNTNSLTQGTAANRPTFLTNQVNGFPMVRFDGTNDYFDLSNNTDLNSGGPYSSRTFITMIRTGANVTTRQMIFEEGGTGRGMNMYIFNGNLYIGAYNLNTDASDTPWGFVSLSTAITTNTNYILTFLYKGNSCKTGTIVMYLNGNLVGTINNIGRLFAHTGAIGIGAKNTDTYYENGTSSGTGDYFNGSLGEFIMYNYNINEPQRIIIENYLSAKYAIALGANDIYTMDNAPENYDYQVAGIGRTSLFEFDNDSKGTGAVHIRNPSGLGNNEYFIWGHNNLAISAAGITDLPAGVPARLARTWRATEVGEVGTFNISFDLSAVPGSKTAADLRLLIDRDNDGVFADETIGTGGVISGASDLGGSVFSFAGVDINNGQRFTIGSVNATNTPLPISLISFTARYNGSEVGLKWTTASELNNDFYTVQRSADGETFADLFKIPGAGTTADLRTYEESDLYPMSGISYYRLQQTDFDGAVSYSPLVKVEVRDRTEVTLNVYPNPINQGGVAYVQVSPMGSGEGCNIIVSDLTGRTVSSQPWVATTNTDIPLDVSSLSSGIYIVTIWGDSRSFSKRLLVK